MEAIIRIVALGGAVGVVTPEIAADGLKSGILREIKVDAKLPSFTFYASYNIDTVDINGKIVAEMAKDICFDKSA